MEKNVDNNFDGENVYTIHEFEFSKGYFQKKSHAVVFFNVLTFAYVYNV